MMRRAVELLADGEWHDYDEVIREVGKLVTPGKAIRRNEVDRTRRWRVDHDDEVETPAIPQRRNSLSTARAIDSGRRALARDALLNKYFDIDPKTPGRRAGVQKHIRLAATPPGLLRGPFDIGKSPASIISDLTAADQQGDDGAAVTAIFDDLHQVQLEMVVRHLLGLDAR